MLHEIALQMVIVGPNCTYFTCQGVECCAFGTNGLGPTLLKGGGDCIIIPGAADADAVPKADKICGTMNGLVTVTTATGNSDAANSKTICCKCF